jgi:hypothetical protein
VADIYQTLVGVLLLAVITVALLVLVFWINRK